MKFLRPWGLAAAVAACGIGIAAGGCERNADTQPDGGGGTSSSFVLFPGGITVGTNQAYAAFQARGGVLPYRWSVANTNLGSLQGVVLDTPIRVKTVTYLPAASTGAGINTLQVTDARGWQATASVIHE